MAQNFTRYFTLDEAREALPEIVAQLQTIQQHRAELSKLAAEMEDMTGAALEGKPARQRLSERLAEVGLRIDELIATGILVRNLETGLIDFPSRRDGDDIFLCFQLGEVDIEYWHPIHDGFDGRRPL